MNEAERRSLHERVEKLERKVEEIQRILAPREASPGEPSPVRTGAPAPEVPERAGSADKEIRPSPPVAAIRPTSGRVGRMENVGGGWGDRPVVQPASGSPDTAGSIRDSESWLGKIGIGLVLFGVIFLFKYSIDQGWITPPVRVLFGLAIGIGLLVAGNRMKGDRRPLGRVMSGGGIGALYISGFAAYRLYELVTHPAAFAFMVLVTLLAFLLSQRQRDAVLSVIGTAGGFGTPFLLYQGSGSLPGLVGYTCLVLSGAVAVSHHRGWRSLQWTAFAGFWLIFIGVINPQVTAQGPAALQTGILFGWLAFSAMPVLREIREARRRAREAVPGSRSDQEFPHAHFTAAVTPLLGLWLSGRIWSLSRGEWGWLALGTGIVYGLASLTLKGRDAKTRLAYTHALLGLLFGTLSLCLLLEGDALFFTLAVEATLLHLISRKLADRGTAGCAHALFVAVAVWLGMHLGMRVMTAATVDARAMTDLAVILIAAGISRVILPRDIASFYRILAHLAFLAWIWGALTPLPNGVGYVSITWGIYAVLLLIFGFRLNRDGLRAVAMGTLLLVVGKLFLVDLASLKAIWRIMLFLGFGGTFLGLSHLVRTLWRPGSGS